MRSILAYSVNGLNPVIQIFEYSKSKIQQIFQEIKQTINPEELCNMYWRRMVKIIKSMTNTGVTDNSLWDCILHLNIRNIKKEWRQWLISKDESFRHKDSSIQRIKKCNL